MAVEYVVPYFVEPVLTAAPLFYRLKAGELQLVKDGIPRSLVEGPEYILVNARLASLLRASHVRGLSLQSAKLLIPHSEHQWDDYFEMIIEQELTFERSLQLLASRAECSGMCVWHYQRSGLFVSPALRDEIIAAQFDDLRFSPGFASWAG